MRFPFCPASSIAHNTADKPPGTCEQHVGTANNSPVARVLLLPAGACWNPPVYVTPCADLDTVSCFNYSQPIIR